MYSSPLSLTSSLDGGRWSTLHPSCFAPGKEIYCTFCRSMDGSQGRCGQVQKISTLLWDLIPGRSTPQRITIVIDLSRPTRLLVQLKTENDYLKFEFSNKTKLQFYRTLERTWPPYVLVSVSNKFRSSECSVLGRRLKAPRLVCFSRLRI